MNKIIFIHARLLAMLRSPKILAVLAITLLLLSFNAEPAAAAVCAANAFQYRTAASGIWADNATWDVSTDGGGTWAAAGCWPSSINGTIRIQNGHTITVDASISVDQVNILTGGAVVVNNGATWNILNGLGTDLAVSGTLTNAGTITAAGARVFNPGSVYRHVRDGGGILTGTWNINATLEVTGIVSTMPAGFNQTFGNVIWNNPGQSAPVTMLGNTTVAGNFSMVSTGTGSLVIANTLNRNLIVNGNFIMTGGTVDMSGGTAVGRIYSSGNFTQSGGTFTVTGTNTGSGIIFSGTAVQNYTGGGAVTNVVNYTVNNGAFVYLGTWVVTGNGRFTVNSGATLGIGSPDGITLTGTAAGNIQTALRTYNGGGNYLYNGTVNQNIGSGLPNNLAGDLIINNPGTVTLNIAKRIGNGGLIELINGTLATGTNLTMVTTSLINRSGGSMTGTPQGLGLYDVNYTGNSKTTTSELLGAGVNHVTNLLTAGQTLTLGGEAIINGNLVNASGILDTANNPVTLNGSFTNLSTFNAGSSAITIGGSSIAPTIAGFITTGPLNFTRSASTAAFTGQVTAGALTINGSGGTLDLAAGFSHQFNGDVTFTNGTLNANASDIGLTGNWANNGGSFLAGTGTVTFNGTAPQIISGNVTAFENLTINPGAIVTVPATNSPTVANTVVNNGGLRQSAVIGVGGTHQFLNLQTGGGATRYRGIDFTSTAGDPGTVTVLVRGNQDACDGYNFIIHRCYTLDLTGSPTATLTFYYENSELNGSACAIMQAYHWNGNTWDTALTLDPTFYDDGRQCTGEGTADGTAANPWALQVTNVSSFSPFGVTSGGSPTAIRLKDLSGSSANPGPTLLFVSLFALMGGAVVWVLRRK